MIKWATVNNYCNAAIVGIPNQFKYVFLKLIVQK